MRHLAETFTRGIWQKKKCTHCCRKCGPRRNQKHSELQVLCATFAVYSDTDGGGGDLNVECCQLVENVTFTQLD